ncbi:c-type cytochrome [Mucilaginibacter glaciei]|uniref:Cytochrome c n=1 Tax=Mucilaginibacter glaciei TaxID=2772109 RepID=A0A926S4Z3_9SPHI|nr:cytochrome c [Mucilaginibacter glaciei]MBD1392231.1 cytochrome c [Mucilaginibacter glaciei]
MKSRVIGLLTVLIAVIIASCQSEDELEFQRYYNGGKKLYEQKCQNCHSAKGDGLSNLIPPLTDAIYLKKNKALLACMVKYGIKETIITINGKSYEGAMPANDLAPVDIAKVLTYVTNSFGNKMGVIKSEVIDRYLAGCK